MQGLDRPLAGVTVVDLTVNIAGPSATLILADLGARVLKVEPPGGDVSRTWSPQDTDGFSSVFSAFNRGKESIVLDAKSVEGQRLLHELVKHADVFIESMRPGKADALGLGWDALREINERLIYCSVNAFGNVGPLAGVAGFDAVVQAYSGLMDLTGHPGGDPARVGGAVVDVGAGTWAALEILAALLQRQQDGKGARVQSTMLGTAISYMLHHLVSTRLGVEPTRLGSAQHNFAPYQAIRTSDRLVMVGVNSDAMWKRAALALGVPELADDDRFRDNVIRNANRVELIAEIERALEMVPAERVVDRLAAAGVPAAVVRPIGALIDDPQLDAMGMWGTTSTGTVLPRTPAADPDLPVGDVPYAGEHTVAILSEFGIEGDELSHLMNAFVVEQHGLGAMDKELT
ncbi:CaiB/BaiF CoA-transferase family protein [Nocardioides sp. LS1]|uniref:CaiB/BaiF CoA transferase family protein n=1 Tax=Nocardioides sp. LS1 TaxID=1027620 RepID=UPI000F616F5B|nr:CoA transferase [Nocardioides sp. LS1]GCD91112.1 CoA transferase [Nocardioides sp. LS1]